jgi:hypothetical protein
MRNDHDEHTRLSNKKNHSLTMTMHWLPAQSRFDQQNKSFEASVEKTNVGENSDYYFHKPISHHNTKHMTVYFVNV